MATLHALTMARAMPLFFPWSRLAHPQTLASHPRLPVARCAFIHPATHYASSNTDPNAPPMGLRVRLKASYDLTRFHGTALVIMTALKKYGLIVADNGSDWFITGATDSRWDDEDLNQLKTVPANVFEVVQSGPIIK